MKLVDMKNITGQIFGIRAERIFNQALTTIIITSLFILTSCSPNKEKASENDKANEVETPDFQISLAQWSLHRKYFGNISERGGYDWFVETLQNRPDEAIAPGEDPIDFPKEAASYGVNSIELVNTFYLGKVDNFAYWDKFKQNCEQAEVEVGLIMCDMLGNLGDSDPEARNTAVEKHYKWVDVAKYLGAHTIRVNAAGQGTAEEVAMNAAAGLKKLGEYGKLHGINIVVENHGGYSSDGAWLAGVMEAVDMENVGTLPDFGNFCIENGPDGCVKEYDRYKGIEELMPYAKAVSAKSLVFNENGDEANIDFYRIMKIVKDSGFKGHIGIEYEGSELSEEEGIKKTMLLLEKVFETLD
jgi:sugar phosphate isomerase/epimerase